jgi:SfnB family sulfur acquisition oxidoreductase
MSVAALRKPAAAPIVLRTAADAHQTALDFAELIAPGAIERDRSGALPVAELQAFDLSGLPSLTVPERDGGPGLPISVVADVVRTIARADPAVAQGPQGHFLIVDALALAGTQRQRRQLLGDVLRGARISAALAERGGAHAQDLQTKLSGDGDGGLRLDGRKYYTTGSLTAQWLGVSAVDRRGEVVLAFVRRDQDGITLDYDWNPMGQRATVSGGAEFEAVVVDPELVLPWGVRFEIPQQLGARAQLYHAAIQVGIAAGALQDASWFLTEKARPFFEAVRNGWADSAAEDPHTIHRYGELATRVAAAEALLARAAAKLDQIGLEPADAETAAEGSIAVAQLKAFASDTAVQVASDLFSLTGASAADERYDLSRHWRNARTHASHDPVDWKYHHVGNYLLSGVLPPNHGQL